MGSHSGASNIDTDRLLLEILEEVAEVRDEEITSLPPISEFFDSEGLERFLQSTTVPTTVTLDVYGCRVEIDGEGNITVTAHEGDD